ncbi:MAG: putative metal-dependent hydrolase [Moraxellaceae bacterium]|jgi:predicted metal-dependent hydrolase|nr:putative metal-dependent hydrolase [Moraxellaceae bacterium]
MSADHKLLPRRVRFDLSRTPLHWIPHDPEASYIINSIHLLLPAGEFWFCRVYNKALPYITDARLREDVQGFVRQEAIHARSHETALNDYLRRHGIEIDGVLRVADWVFGQLLEEKPLPLGDNFVTRRLRQRLERFRLRQHLAIIAAIEHYTCVLGKWVLEAEALDAPGVDPDLRDLFRWHGAEEVEHRCVAHDLHAHLGGTTLERQAWALAAFPVLMSLLAYAGKHLMAQDPAVGGQFFFARWERASRRGTLPTLESLFGAAARYLDSDYHPEGEATLEQALAYFAKSPAVQEALAKAHVAAAA